MHACLPRCLMPMSMHMCVCVHRGTNAHKCTMKNVRDTHRQEFVRSVCFSFGIVIWINEYNLIHLYVYSFGQSTATDYCNSRSNSTLTIAAVMLTHLALQLQRKIW